MRYKLLVIGSGVIVGIEKNYSDEPDPNSIYIEDAVIAEEILADTGKARLTKYYDTDLEEVLNKGAITAEPDRLEIQADGSDLFILTGLPIPCTVTVSDLDIETDDIISEVTDGEFGFPTAIAGEYKVKVESFPYITKEWTVVAT